MDNIFISYAREDTLFVRALRDRLAEEGFATWIDLDKLRAGAVWADEIDRAIRESLALIVVLTPAASESDYVAYEWAFGLGAGLKVLPVLLEPVAVTHPQLQSRQHLDFTSPPDRPWKRLCDELRQIAQTRQTHSIRIPRGAPPVIQKAAGALDSLDADAQRAAIESLGQMRHETVAETLAEATRHPVREVRVAAAQQLARRKDSRALPGLLEGWQQSGQPSLIDLAAQCGPAIVRFLLETLRDDEAAAREFAARSLGLLGERAAVSDLLTALRDRQAAVRGAAAEALGRVRDGQALAGLREALADAAASVRSSAARALGGLKDWASVGALVKCLREDLAEVSQAAAFALGEIGNAAVVPELLEMFNDPDVNLYPHLAEALGKLGDERAVPVLLQALERHTFGEIYSAYGKALGRLKAASAVPGLIECLRHERSQVVSTAALALGEIGGASATAALVEALAGGTTRGEPITAALKRIGTAEATAAARKWERQHGEVRTDYYAMEPS